MWTCAKLQINEKSLSTINKTFILFLAQSTRQQQDQRLDNRNRNICQLRLFVLIQKHKSAITFFTKNDNFIFSSTYRCCRSSVNSEYLKLQSSKVVRGYK